MTRRARMRRTPMAIGIVLLGAWELGVRIAGIAPSTLPGPLLVLETLWIDAALLARALWVTLEVTLAALLAAAGAGAALALVMARARWLARGLTPHAVIVQMTPIVAIAPLVVIWTGDGLLSRVACVWIVAVFPVLAHTLAGLNGADRNPRDLFRLYGAGRWQTRRWLEAPAALPGFLTGLRISGGLALIGAVVAEFVAGSGGAEPGLGMRIVEAGQLLQTPRLFAALVLLTLAGIAIHAATGALSRHALRRWHGDGDSAQ